MILANTLAIDFQCLREQQLSFFVFAGQLTEQRQILEFVRN